MKNLIRLSLCCAVISAASAFYALPSTATGSTKTITESLKFGSTNIGRLNFSRAGEHGKLVALKNIGEAKGSLQLQVPPEHFVELEFAPSVYLKPEMLAGISFKGVSGLKLAYFSMDEVHPALCDAVLKVVVPNSDLKYVNVDRSDATDDGLKSLAAAKNLCSVSAFGTATNGSFLKELLPLKGVAHLNLSSTPFDSKNLKYIPSFKKLVDLNLRQTRCDDAGVAIISANKSIRWLNLSVNSGITDKSIDALCSMESLRSIDLQQTSMTFEGLKKLSTLPLTELNFSRRLLTAKQISELQVLLPKAKLNVLGGYNSEQKALFAPLP